MVGKGRQRDGAEAGLEFSFHGETIRVNLPDRASLERAVRERLDTGAGFALATINLDHLDKLGRDADFRAAYVAQDFVVADGNPIVWLSRLAGQRVELMPGSEMVLPLCRWAAEAGVALALVGSSEEALARAGAVIEAEVPGSRIALRLSPPMGFDAGGGAADDAIAALAQSGAGLCLLALGAPRQELFSVRVREAVPQMGVASIGAGLDFLAGTQVRAPKWARAIAMEWLWRALRNPLRLGPRYLRSLAALPGHALRAWRLR